MILKINKPKAPKGFSYVLKSSFLKNALESNNIEISTFITYWKPQKISSGDNIFECNIRRKDKRVDHDQLLIRTGTVESKNRKDAEELLIQKVIPKFIEWIKKAESLPDNSTLLREFGGFYAFYKDGEVNIDCSNENS